MANNEPYCQFWSLETRFPYTDYVRPHATSWRFTLAKYDPNSALSKSVVFFDEYDLDLVGNYERSGFKPILGNLDGSISVSRQTDLLRRAFVNVEFPAVWPAGSAVKITYENIQGLTFQEYGYKNNL